MLFFKYSQIIKSKSNLMFIFIRLISVIKISNHLMYNNSSILEPKHSHIMKMVKGIFINNLKEQ